MKSVLFTLTILLAVAARKCNSPKEALPSCIREKIAAIKQQPRWNPPAEVYEYEYECKRLFYFSSDCCDQLNTVVDENCNYICAPSGGITGKGDRKCDNFTETARKVRLVWKDERE